MDLTQGYHQALMHPASRIFTAFIIFSGMYQFTRVPFGPKRAPSYFQEQMARFVLAGLLYIIFELYLDDITVFGSTEDDFIVNLRTVLRRLSTDYLQMKTQLNFLQVLKEISKS